MTWSSQMAGLSTLWLLLCLCEAMAVCDKTPSGESCDRDGPPGCIISISAVTWPLQVLLLQSKCPCLC